MTMAEVLLFHHAQGLTPGVRAFADRLRAAGHTVHAPDLYEGETFASIEDGVHHAHEVLGFGTVLQRGWDAAVDLPDRLVYGGFSLGALPARSLIQQRPGARGALLFHAAPPAVDGAPWPPGVPLQIHAMEHDPWMEEDFDEARRLAAEVDGAELFVYPGSRHLFADDSLPDYDVAAAQLLTARTFAFLDRVW
jgi:dienelactone hydrolase